MTSTGDPQGGPLAASHLDLRYDPAEDRLVLTARDASRRLDLALTRRLARGLLRGMIDLLMRTSPEVGRAGAGHREDVLLFEHAGALAALQATAVPMGEQQAIPPASATEQPVLLGRVDLNANQHSLTLMLVSLDQPVSVLVLPWEKAHQLLSVLLGKTKAAEWGFEELAWVDRQGQVVLSSGITPN